MYVDAGIVVLAAFISPYREDRAYVKEVVGAEDFFEVYVQCSLEVCENRDPKGLYKKARAGIIKNYTGIDAPYEEPLQPDLVIDTVRLDVASSVESVLRFLDERKFILLL
ncbi:MAG TPA: adenylyl-sulfate kinase [Thermodesulfovibrionales bacterium]|nr:adenylyl-sulfate kinase [Thermodesulfovibrionales bacterium]